MADPVDALAVRQRAGGRDRRRRGDAGARGARTCASSRQGGDGGTTDIGFALPLGHVRAQRRRALHLLRQRRLHEHRRPALLRDAAGGAHRDDAGDRPEPGNVFGPGKSAPKIAVAHEIPYVATATRRRPARPRGQGHGGDGAPRRRATSRSTCPARSAGVATAETRSCSPGSRRRPASSPSSRHEMGAITAVSQHPPPGAGAGVPAPPEALRAPLQRRADAPDVIARLQAQARSATSRAFTCSEIRTRRATSSCSTRSRRGARAVSERPFAITLDVGSSLANRTGDWRTERPVYVASCRPATTAARPARTSRAGCTRRSPASYEARMAALVRTIPARP